MILNINYLDKYVLRQSTLTNTCYAVQHYFKRSTIMDINLVYYCDEDLMIHQPHKYYE